MNRICAGAFLHRRYTVGDTALRRREADRRGIMRGDHMTAKSRREVLALGAGTAALALIGEIGPAAATPQEAAEVIAKFTGGKTAEKGKISIDLPEIAENGNTVPLTITVESPMTADDHVSNIIVVAE